MYRSDDSICKDIVNVILILELDIVGGWMTSHVAITTYQCHFVDVGVEGYCKNPYI